jgi:hypothetical protein
VSVLDAASTERIFSPSDADVRHAKAEVLRGYGMTSFVIAGCELTPPDCAVLSARGPADLPPFDRIAAGGLRLAIVHLLPVFVRLLD